MQGSHIEPGWGVFLIHTAGWLRSPAATASPGLPPPPGTACYHWPVKNEECASEYWARSNMGSSFPSRDPMLLRPCTCWRGGQSCLLSSGWSRLASPAPHRSLHRTGTWDAALSQPTSACVFWNTTSHNLGRSRYPWKTIYCYFKEETENWYLFFYNSYIYIFMHL